MEITVKFSQHEREQFIAWIRTTYPEVEIDNTIDVDSVSNSTIRLNELWTAYCES